MIACNDHQHDFGALGPRPTRVVIGVGRFRAADGRARGPGRGRAAGHAPTTFPGDHGGFLRADFNPNGDPDAFAATLRETLAG